VVKPQRLQDAVRVVELCAAQGLVVYPQGQNTSLTGGGVPREQEDPQRRAVVVNMSALNDIYVLEKENKVLCCAGAGIYSLSEKLKPLQRQSHSVLGSFFLNPSVAAGLALSSGGTQLRKGPVYTERVLYLKINEDRSVEVVDTLGLQAAQDSVHLIDSQPPASSLVLDPRYASRRSSDAERYAKSLTDSASSAVSRCNANVEGIDPVRSEGKVLILASIHDTFPCPSR
jgi:D-lactate dehydrogenase